MRTHHRTHLKPKYKYFSLPWVGINVQSYMTCKLNALKHVISCWVSKTREMGRDRLKEQSMCFKHHRLRLGTDQRREHSYTSVIPDGSRGACCCQPSSRFSEGPCPRNNSKHDGAGRLAHTTHSHLPMSPCTHHTLILTHMSQTWEGRRKTLS